MLVLQNNNNNMWASLGIAALLTSIAMPASALILVERNPIWQTPDGIRFHSNSIAQGNTAHYMITRSHRWMQYHSGRHLVNAPLAGKMFVVSPRQSSASSLMTRAHAYRLGERW